MTAGLCSQKTQNAAYFSGSSDTEIKPVMLQSSRVRSMSMR